MSRLTWIDDSRLNDEFKLMLKIANESQKKAE